MTCERGPHAVDVIVDVQVHDVDRIFTYAVPDTLERPPAVGDRVIVPFGRRKAVEGYVVGFAPANGRADLKPIARLLDPQPLLTEADIAVARWMQSYYLCPLVQALQCFLPPGVRLRSKARARALFVKGYRLNDPEKALAYAAQVAKAAPKQAALIRFLAQQRAFVSYPALQKALNISRAPLERLVAQGIVVESSVPLERSPLRGQAGPRPQLTLNREQADALAAICTALDRGEVRQILLHGVTGSGKTEVYLRAIEHVRRQGKGAILLVPEIALTEQTVTALEEAFGSDVAVIHSRLSAGERFDQWHRLRRGEAGVAVGARSAVFAPVQRLGLIIIDEEHESSYKQGEAPRYHARDVAWARARAAGALLVLGSATPSLESRYACDLGAVERRILSARVDGRPLPPVEVVDMRRELARGNRSMFSARLVEGIERALSAGEQVLLFMNRRGFASFLLCRECGHVPRCDQCEVSLTFHQPDRLRCHYCDGERRLPRGCPQCGGPYLRPFGGGTQRVQEELARLFPGARTVRMDLDTTARKGAHARILREFAARAYDVLIGTQMIAKGLHFPAVTLVGVVSADTGLHFPEYRAAERTFQLLTQVAGRAGRGQRPGEVIVQTYDPDHYAIRAAVRHDYAGFYEQEMAYRRRAGYPPFVAMARCLWSAEEEAEARRAADEGYKMVEGLARQIGVDLVGPCPAPLSRLKGRYRWHLLLKGERESVVAAARRVQESIRPGAAARLAVDVDPVSLL